MGERTILDLELQIIDLQAKVAKLELELSKYRAVDRFPRLAPAQAILSPTQFRLVRVLARGGLIPRSAFNLAGADNNLSCQMTHIRSRLKPYGISIESVMREGYYVKEGLDELRQLLEPRSLGVPGEGAPGAGDAVSLGHESTGTHYLRAAGVERGRWHDRRRDMRGA